MRVEYHPDTDTALLELVEGVPDVEGEEVADGVIVHFDENDRPVRIEIYDRAKEKLAGLLVGAGLAPEVRRSEDERALETGRAWIAGYRAGRADRDAGISRSGAAKGGHDEVG